MLKIYGTMLCPDCKDTTALYRAHQIEFEFLDFGDAIQNLKDFLKIRDTSPLFDQVKAAGQIGIPCILFEDGTVTLNPEDAMASKREGR